MESCPPFNNFFYPLMQLALDEEIRVRDASEMIADQFNLSKEVRLDMVPSGIKPRYVDRTEWAATYLRQAGLLVTVRRGYVKASDVGHKFIKKLETQKIEISDLNQFESFRNFRSRQKPQAKKDTQFQDEIPLTTTPMDKISDGLSQIEDALVSDILERLTEAHPSFFEKTVIDLLMAMGYGGQNGEAGRITGKPGDDGIDGVIDQDQLGLDRVYVQAKRYASNNTISPDSVRSFTGALVVHQASKGIFFTTSSFSKGAIKTADKVAQRVVLIDGIRLAKLMIAYGVGCTAYRKISIMQIDSDYFE